MVDTCTLGVDTGFATLGYAKVAALGVLQGITELLPISSTAHMRLVPAFLGWQDPGILRRDAARGAGRRHKLFLERCTSVGGEFSHGDRPGTISRSAFAFLHVDRIGDDPNRDRRIARVEAT